MLLLTNLPPGEWLDGSQNSAGLDIYCILTKSGSTVSLQIFSPPYPANAVELIQSGHLAHLTVPNMSVKSAVTKDLSLSATLIATPNPSASTYYEVGLTTSFPVLNLNYLSANYFDLMFFSYPTSNTGSIVYATMQIEKTSADVWIQSPGLVFSNSWQTNEVITVSTAGDNKKQSVSFTINIPKESFVNLADGSYGLNLFAIMQPYTPPSLFTIVTNVDTMVINQLNYLYNLELTIEGSLNQQNVVIQYTSAEIATMQANLRLLEKMIADIVTSTTTYFNSAINSGSLTSGEIAQVQTMITNLAIPLTIF